MARLAFVAYMWLAGTIDCNTANAAKALPDPRVDESSTAVRAGVTLVFSEYRRSDRPRSF